MSRGHRDCRDQQDPQVLWGRWVLLVRMVGLAPQVRRARRVRRVSLVQPVSLACLGHLVRQARWVLTAQMACRVPRVPWGRTDCRAFQGRRVSTERRVFLASPDRLASTDFRALQELRASAAHRAPTVLAECPGRTVRRVRRGRLVRQAPKALQDRSVGPQSFWLPFSA